MLLVAYPLTYTAPPFPDDAAHDVNVVFDSLVPVIESVFSSPTDPHITTPFTELPDRFANEHDVMVTSVDRSNRITGLETLKTSDGVTLTDVRLSFLEEIEKREYPIEYSDGLNAMEHTVRLDPAQMKRESLSEDDELNSLVTAASPSAG